MTRTLVLFSLLLAPLSTALAHPDQQEREAKSQEHGDHDRKPAHDQRVEKRIFAMIAEHGDELGLDEEAQEAIREVVDAHKQHSEKLHEELKTANDDLKSLVEEESPELDSVLIQADIVSTLKGELFKQHLTTLIELRKHLTDEQIQEIKERVVRRMKHQKRNGQPHKGQ